MFVFPIYWDDDIPNQLGLMDYSGLMDCNGFSHSVGNVIIPSDVNSMIFQRGRVQPPSSYFSYRIEKYSWSAHTNPYNVGTPSDICWFISTSNIQ